MVPVSTGGVSPTPPVVADAATSPTRPLVILAATTRHDHDSGWPCQTCGQPLGVVPDDPEPLYFHLQPTGAADHEPRPDLGDLPPAGVVIVVSHRSQVEIVPNVAGSGLTGLTVRVGDQQTTVALHARLVDELCHQMAVHSPIPYHSEPGQVPPAGGDVIYQGGGVRPADAGTFSVEPLPELDAAGSLMVDTPQVRVTTVPDAPGWTRLTIRHAGAMHSVSLPERVADQLMDRGRRWLIEQAWQATRTPTTGRDSAESPAAAGRGGDR